MLNVSFNKTAPAAMDTAVAIPMKDEVLFTPIFAIAMLDKKNAIIEQPIP